MQEYDKLKASDPDFYRAADSMSYGGAGKVPDANIDKMVAELNERYHLLSSLVAAQRLHMGQAARRIWTSAAVCRMQSITVIIACIYHHALRGHHWLSSCCPLHAFIFMRCARVCKAMYACCSLAITTAYPARLYTKD